VFTVKTNGSGFTVLREFEPYDADFNEIGSPSGDLILGLLGVSEYLLGPTGGGPEGGGTVFSINPYDSNDSHHWGFGFAPLDPAAGTNNYGADPLGGVILNGTTIIGTAEYGGSAGAGTLFTYNLFNDVRTVLHDFGSSDGAHPVGSIIEDGATLYGVTDRGGSWGYGTVFTIDTFGSNFTVLHSFSGSDGAHPVGGLCLSGGALYGTTSAGGSYGNGTVFSINGSGFTSLHSFAGSDGANPLAGLSASGNTLYGTTSGGGASGLGTVFRLRVGCPPIGLSALDSTNLTLGSAYNQTIKASGGYAPYSFAVTSGSLPGGLGLSGDGTLSGTPTNLGVFNFGVTATESAGCTGSNSYTIVVSPPCPAIALGTLGSTNLNTDSSYDQTITASGGAGPYNFAVASGSLPSGLGLSGDGALSGRPTQVGSFSFSVTATDTNGCTGTNSYALIITQGPYSYYSFTTANGAYPAGGLVLSGSTLYGTASQGGDWNDGAVFKLNTDGTGFTNVFSFAALNFDSGIGKYTNSGGVYPVAGLILSGDTLYGTADHGGSSGVGTVFAVNTNGTGFTSLYNFSGNTDGAYPDGRLILSSNTLYGTASEGGSAYNGTVFTVSANGTGFTNLHSFTADSGSPDYTNSDGANPYPGLVLSGNTLYATAADGGSAGNGTVFAINTDGTGFKVLHHFTALDTATQTTNSDGAYPTAGLLLLGDMLYGAASGGGSSGNGTVFKVNTNGMGFTTLYSFTVTAPPYYTNSDGGGPAGGLASSGSTLYGAAAYGGSSDNGTVFAINTDGTGFRTLYNFEGNDGSDPYGDLILSDHILYGTTRYGGSLNKGVVFSLSLSVSAPRLTIIAAGGSVVLTWPANGATFTLQCTTNLVSPASWTNVSPGPVVVNGQNAVTNPISGTQKFYRLSNQSQSRLLSNNSVCR
jgi:uncharacterized repeat protein (TIGR03803 family)